MDKEKEVSTVILGDQYVNYIEEALDIIDDQWPHEKAIRETRYLSMKSGSPSSLPLHVVLVADYPCRLLSNSNADAGLEKVVIAYAKMQGAYGKDYGNSAILYSVVVKREMRGNGFGREIMQQCENIAKTLGLSYLYLFTDDKLEFYRHLGYKECEPISSLGENSKRLKPEQLEALESIFAKRLNIPGGSHVSTNKHQTWLRKRLLTTTEIRPPCDKITLCNIVAKEFKDHQSIPEDKTKSLTNVVNIMHLDVPLEPQVGPMCGITAINMAAHTIFNYSTKGSYKTHLRKETVLHQAELLCNCCGELNLSSLEDPKLDKETLLNLAISLGITGDGEMFCAYNLGQLLAMWYGIPAKVIDIEDKISFQKLVLHSLVTRSPLLLPYDRDVGGFKPSLQEGKAAHWAVVFGVAFQTNEVLFANSTTLVDSISVTRVCPDNQNEYGSMNKYLLDSLEQGVQPENFSLLCVHGMSKLPFVCTFSDMIASNANLRLSGNLYFHASKELFHLKNKAILIS